MTNQSSLNRAARTAGFLYLVIIAAGLFAEMFVRGSLIVPGDATTTANNIMASQGLFRLGIVSDIIMIVSDVAIGLAFYVLLKPVNHTLSLTAAFFRLAQAATLGVNLLVLFFALRLLSGADYLTVISTDQIYAQALLFLEMHATGYRIGLVFFAFSLLVQGYLIFKARYLPAVLGILLMIASVGYLVDSFADFLMPNYEQYEAMFTMIVFLPAFIAELALCLWLLIKGVNTHPEDHIISLNTQAEAL